MALFTRCSTGRNVSHLRARMFFIATTFYSLARLFLYLSLFWFFSLLFSMYVLCCFCLDTFFYTCYMRLKIEIETKKCWWICRFCQKSTRNIGWYLNHEEIYTQGISCCDCCSCRSCCSSRSCRSSHSDWSKTANFGKCMQSANSVQYCPSMRQYQQQHQQQQQQLFGNSLQNIHVFYVAHRSFEVRTEFIGIKITHQNSYLWRTSHRHANNNPLPKKKKRNIYQTLFFIRSYGFCCCSYGFYTVLVFWLFAFDWY